MLQFKKLMPLMILSTACLMQTYCCALDTTVIPEEDLSTRNIASALKEAGMKVEIDDDGDIKVRLSGEELWVQCNIEKSRVYLMAYRVFRNSAELEDKYHLANRINDEFVLIRACLTKNKERLWLDYTFPTEAGITFEQIVNAIERFVSIMSSIDDKDDNNILK